MVRELLVVEDLAAAAVGLFLAVEPRSVALAGGSTPRPFYEALAKVEYPWRRLEVFFGDERCVPPDHPDSNFAMANAALLSRVPASVHPMTGCDPAAYARELEAAAGSPPALDIVFLGLGDDGHTASLFPGDPVLEERSRWVARVERPDHPRLTLTVPVLSGARVACFLVSGKEKRDRVRDLLDGADIPAARVAAGRVVILADREAAPVS